MSLKPVISVIGGGSWATALIKILSNNVDTIHWWVRTTDTADFINKYRHNPNYLSDVEINLSKVKISNDMKKSISSSDIIILAVPSAFFKSALGDIKPENFKNKTVFSAIKGIIPDDLLIIGDYLREKLEIPLNKIGVITGPCHAEEVAMERLSYLTIASTDLNTANTLASLMNCRYIKTSEIGRASCRERV